MSGGLQPRAMASNLLAMVSKLLAMASNPLAFFPNKWDPRPSLRSLECHDLVETAA